MGVQDGRPGWVQDGGPGWGPRMGIQDGGPGWVSRMGVQDGGPGWEARMGVQDRSPGWRSRMGVQDGRPGWVQDGGPGCNSKLSFFAVKLSDFVVPCLGCGRDRRCVFFRMGLMGEGTTGRTSQRQKKQS